MCTITLQLTTPPKAWVLGRSTARIVGSNSARETFVFCQLEVSASVCSPVLRGSTECDVSECDHEASTVRRPWLTMGAVLSWKKNNTAITSHLFVCDPKHFPALHLSILVWCTDTSSIIPGDLMYAQSDASSQTPLFSPTQ